MSLTSFGAISIDFFFVNRLQISSTVEQPAVSELLQELQDVRDEASFTKEQLSSYKESSCRLQDELTVRQAFYA